jgi:putative nucleotidyltransferase with HDIG domain
LIPTSLAIDLAEGRNPAHARRIAFIAASIADALGLESGLQLASCYAGLLHDVGVIAAGAGLADHVVGDERMVFASLPALTPEEIASSVSDRHGLVVDRLVEHTVHGAHAARELALPADAIKGVASHHENWNGTGYPHGLRALEIPIVGRIIAAADQVESMIDHAGSLHARRQLPVWLSHLSGTILEPAVVGALRDVSARDEFWLGLYNSDLATELAAFCARQHEAKAPRLLTFAENFSQVIESRFTFQLGVSSRVASVAEAIGRVAGLSDLRVRQLRLAALFHDVGQLAVSERIIAKPGIFSVDDRDMMREHPLLSSEIVEGISGLEEVSVWIAAHHEWMDGNGYPQGLSGEDIPFESRILAVADTFVSVTSDRPHRPRADTTEAVRRIQAFTGPQFDPTVVELLVTKVLS